MKKLLAGMALFGFLSVAQADTPGDSEFECDDFPACVLQVKAWDALAAEEYKVAYKFAAACVKLDEEAAREQQASLSAKPSDDD